MNQCDIVLIIGEKGAFDSFKLKKYGEDEFIKEIKSGFDKNKDVYSKGYVKLTVGYYNFDEDGGVGDASDDMIEYEYQDIIDSLDKIISKCQERLEKEQKICNILNNYF